jgi:hypothetical protein
MSEDPNKNTPPPTPQQDTAPPAPPPGPPPSQPPERPMPKTSHTDIKEGGGGLTRPNQPNQKSEKRIQE